MDRPLSLCYLFDAEDAGFGVEFGVHLDPLVRRGLIDAWHPGDVLAGTFALEEVDRRLARAAIVLPFLSSAFLASDLCDDERLTETLRRHDAGHARILPIVVRAVQWRNSPLAHLSPLPRSGRSIAEYQQRDVAWVEVILEIERVIAELRPLSPAKEPAGSTGAGIPALAFTVSIGLGRSHAYRFAQPVIRIGRVRSAQVVIDDDAVGRMHATIEVSPDGAVVLHDLGSTTGTYVNGRRVARALLQRGDQVRIGPAQFVFTELPGPLHKQLLKG